MATYTSLTDTELADLLREGDQQGFNEIYHRHWEELYRSAYRVLRDSALCDDILQEIFVWLWEHRDQHRITCFAPYLRAAVKYKVANVIRHGKVRETFNSYVMEHHPQTSMEVDVIEIRELKEIIQRFCTALPERAQQIFRLSRYEYLSNKEIAEKLGISEKTVENQMNINLKKLRVSLGKMSFWSIFL